MRKFFTKYGVAISYVISAAAFYPLLMGICWIVDTVSPRV